MVLSATIVYKHDIQEYHATSSAFLTRHPASVTVIELLAVVGLIICWAGYRLVKVCLCSYLSWGSEWLIIQAFLGIVNGSSVILSSSSVALRHRLVHNRQVPERKTQKRVEKIRNGFYLYYLTTLGILAMLMLSSNCLFRWSRPVTALFVNKCVVTLSR